ncbi:hypothetical protein UA08_05692 [Talaromyces atroroseus]|uniref:Uncharacterized protein n=1 Tax=Talaromyces atroroseus TaxID=1441469 RepID=A0A225AV58_TALAT|nr:hypothetical protein UA08_05692 [Talaromyces atroroseus]OKL58856.1 hypothetical protein UA08_05692 [Talaromyces atroroseus]
MDAIVARVKEWATTANEADRKKVISILRNLSYAIDTPYVGLHLQITVARFGIELGIFAALNEAKEPLSIATLTQKSRSAPEILSMMIEIKRFTWTMDLNYV